MLTCSTFCKFLQDKPACHASATRTACKRLGPEMHQVIENNEFKSGSPCIRARVSGLYAAVN